MSKSRCRSREPTDYWARLNRQELRPREIRDQEILRTVELWRQDTNAPVFSNFPMQNALLDVEGFAAKIEQFGDILTPKEVRDLAGDLFDLILKIERIGDARNYPGFSELLRLSLKKPYDSHDTWIKHAIQRALSVNLRFANDLYRDWRHQSGGANSSYRTPELREYVIQAAQVLYTRDHGLYVRVLDSEFPWSTWFLVVYHASFDMGGAGLENEDWSWFGPVLISAASINPQLVIPQLVVLLTGYEARPGDRGAVHHHATFSDLVAERVFGEKRMRDLMELLVKDFQLQEYDVEISVRFARCQAQAREWLREHPKG